MKKFVLLLTVFILCIALIACSEKKETPETETKKEPASETTSASETEPTIDYDHLVTDSYTKDLKFGQAMECHYHIPQIHIDSKDANEINTEIYNALYDGTMQSVFADMELGNGVPVCLGIRYEWYVNGDMLSLLIAEDFDADVVRYSVYNLVITKGDRVSDEEIVLSKMASQEEYHTHAKKALGSIFWNQYGDAISSWQKSYAETELKAVGEVLALTISERNVDNCLPYLGKDGDLFIIGDVYSLAGAGQYSHVINLSNYELAENYAETVEIPVRPKLTKEQAYEIACKYWEMTPGEKTEDGLTLDVMISGGQTWNGRECYLANAVWFVDDHWSTIDMIYIDAYTGECFSRY